MHCWWECKLVVLLLKTLEVSTEVECMYILWPRSFIPWCIPQQLSAYMHQKYVQVCSKQTKMRNNTNVYQ